MTREEFIDRTAKLVAGLQVAASINHGVFGVGYDPWCDLIHEANGGFGWTNAEECRAAFTKIFEEEKT